MSVNLELYKVFFTVVKAGSITKAAKELYISQPAVSQSIKQLEEQLGGRLFVRTSKGMEMTPEGSAVFEYVERATGLLSEAENKFNQLKNLMIGTIRIGASDNICKNYLLPYIQMFHLMYPDVVMQITNGTSRDTINLLKSGKVDIGFVNFPVYQEQDLDAEECEVLHDVFAGGTKYKHLAASPLPLNELMSYPIILLEKGTNTRRFQDRFFEDNRLTCQPEFELGSHDLCVEFAKKNLGLACVAKEFVTRETDEEQLFLVELETPIPPRSIGWIKLKNIALTFAAQRFIEIVKDKIKM